MPFSPRRFLSVADLGNIEARLFNYDGRMSEFANIKIPTYVVFGTKDEGAVKPVREYIKILGERSNSKVFSSFIIRGASHSFRGYEEVVAGQTVRWLKGLG